MRRFKRILSLVMIFILCISAVPLNQNLLKAEGEPDESTDNFKISAMVYDGQEWHEAIFNKTFALKQFRYKIELDKKYTKIQFFLNRTKDVKKVMLDCIDNYRIEGKQSEIIAIPAGKSIFRFKVDPYFERYNDKYEFTVTRTSSDGSVPRSIERNLGFVGTQWAYPGDIIEIIAATSSMNNAFDKWTVDGSDINIPNPERSYNTFVMPDRNVTLKAIYKKGDVSNSKLRNIFVYAFKDKIGDVYCVSIDKNKEDNNYELYLGEDYKEAYLIMQPEDFILDVYDIDSLQKYMDLTINGSPLGIFSTSLGIRTKEAPLSNRENTFKFKTMSKDKTSTSEYTLKINRGTAKCEVTFNGNNGTGSMKPAEVNKGSDYKLPDNSFTAPANKEFLYWEVNGDHKDPGETVKIESDTEIKAIWKDIECKITFNGNEGTGSMSETVVKKGSEYKLPDNGFTAPANKEFLYWEVNGYHKNPGETVKIDKDTEVKAIWKDIKVKVSFNGNNGTGSMKPAEVNKGSEYTLPDNGFTAPENKEFLCWEVNGEHKEPGETVKIEEDTEIKAIWKDIECKITFNGNEGTGSMSEAFIKKGEEYTLPDNGFTAPENKEFSHWEVNGENKKPGETVKIESDTEVKAIWKDIKVKVSFNGNNGTGSMNPVEVNKGSDYKLPDNGFTAPENKEFLCWEVNGEHKNPGEIVKVEKDTEIKAIWKDIECKITFNGNKGAGSMKEEVVKKGSDYKLPDNGFTAPDGQEFKAWDIDGHEYKEGQLIKVNNNITVKAIWQKKTVKPNPSDPKPDKPNPSDPKPDEPNPSDPKPDEPNPSDPKPDEPNPSDPKPDEPIKPIPEKYLINIMPSIHGEVLADKLEAEENELVTIQTIADYGYKIESISVFDATGKLLALRANQFTMPKGSVKVYAMFKELRANIYPEFDKDDSLEENSRPRRDWYYKKRDEDKKKIEVEEKIKEEEKVKENKEEKPQESKVFITIGSKTLEKVDQGLHTVKTMDSAPYIKSGRTMLPLRYLAEALGFNVTWINETRTVLITDLNLRVEIPVDSNIIIVNGVKYTSDVKPELRNNRTMLPIANIARALGLKDGEDIIWDEINRQVTINRKFYIK